MKEELRSLIDELNIKENCAELIDNAIGMLMLDPVATKNFTVQIAKMPIMIRDAIYWNKFYMFVTGINKIQDDLGSSIKLSNKLFGDSKSKEQNGMRLLGYIDKADSKQKVDYYINATRSLLMGNIQLLALERSGLVIQAGIDANESIETQNYAVSNFGRMVDHYAISLEDDNRQNYYKNEVVQHKLEVDLPTISNEDIEKLLDENKSVH